jgi:hypothetical protein
MKEGLEAEERVVREMEQNENEYLAKIVELDKQKQELESSLSGSEEKHTKSTENKDLSWRRSPMPSKHDTRMTLRRGRTR